MFMTLQTLNSQQKLRQRILESLKEIITDKSYYNLFFKDTYIYAVDGNRIIVCCDNNVSLIEVIKYSDIITEKIREVTETDFSIEFVSKKDLESKNKKDILGSTYTQPFFKNAKLEPSFTFDTFVVGEANNDATQAAYVISRNPGQFYNPLFIFGDSGLGKTHLLNAIGNYIKHKFITLKVLCIGANDFLTEYVSYTRDTKNKEDLQGFLKNYDVLLLDDIQMLEGRIKTLEFFFDIFQHFIQNKKQIVLTSDRKPSELQGISDRLITRFMDGLTIQITKPDISLIEDILKKKIEFNKMDLNSFDNDAISFIANNFQNNVRELNGALTRILFFNTLNGITHVTLETAQNALADLVNVKSNKNKSSLTPETIISVVSNYYHLSKSQITGKLRREDIAIARHIAIYLIRTYLDIPYKQIGKYFSDKDHSTVMSSVKKVENKLKTDTQYQTVVNEIKTRLNL